MHRSQSDNNPTDEPINVRYVVQHGLCVGCGVCEAVCPNDAIRVTPDSDSGVPLPVVNEGLCNGCRMCLNVCYGYKVDRDLSVRIFGAPATPIIGRYITCRIAYANDPVLRYSSASGGCVTALLAYALQQRLIDGAIVTRMEGGNPPRAKAFVATTIDEVLSARGSKYCPVTFADCLRKLENGKRYAVVGLPCHIYGIRRLAEFNAKIRNSVSIYLGVFCGGMPSYLGTSYILRTCNMTAHYITNFEYRGGGWPGRLLIQGRRLGSNRKTEIRIPYPEYWHHAFGFFIPYRCTLCHDGFNVYSDISFGDAWLPRVREKDNRGMSLVITRSEPGERLVLDAFRNGSIQTDCINVQAVTGSQRGMVGFKFLTLRARINICKALRRKLPIFDLSGSPSAKFDGYLSGMMLYLGRAMAFRKTLWWLFDIYVSANSLLDFAKDCATRIKMRSIDFRGGV